MGNVNENIKNYLKDHGISQTFLAKKTGYKIEKINRIVNSSKEVSVAELYTIARALEVDLDIFLG